MTERRFTASRSSHSCGMLAVKGCGRLPPAQWMTMSTSPLARTAPTNASIAAISRKSPLKISALLMAQRRFTALFSLDVHRARRIPASLSWRAIAIPMPPLAPVSRARRGLEVFVAAVIFVLEHRLDARWKRAPVGRSLVAKRGETFARVFAGADDCAGGVFERHQCLHVGIQAAIDGGFGEPGDHGTFVAEARGEACNRSLELAG